MNAKRYNVKLLRGSRCDKDQLKFFTGVAANIILRQAESLGYLDSSIKSFAVVHSNLMGLATDESNLMVVIANPSEVSGSVYIVSENDDTFSVIREYIYGIEHSSSRGIMEEMVEQFIQGENKEIIILHPSVYNARKMFIKSRRN